MFRKHCFIENSYYIIYETQVGRIVKNNPVKEFTGYVSGEETNKKIIHDVFSKGDTAFVSGTD